MPTLAESRRSAGHDPPKSAGWAWRLLPVALIVLFGWPGHGRGQASDAPAAQQQSYKVGILTCHQTPLALEAVEAFQRAFDLGQIPHTYDLVEVRGDQALAVETLQRWNQDKVDLIFTVGTEASLLAVQEAQDTPVVFIAAPDPALVGPGDASACPARNATGSSTSVDMAARLRLFRECLPHLKVLGVVCDRSSVVAAAEVAEARLKAKSVKLTLREATVTQAREIAPAIEKLTQEGIDALWVPTDTLLLENLPRIAAAIQSKKVPVVTSAPEGMDPAEENLLSLVAVVADYAQLGRLSAETALDIVTAGKSPSDIPVRRVAPHAIIVNADAAAAMGCTVPPPFLAKAHKVLRGYEGQTVTIPGTDDSQELLQDLAQALLDGTQGGQIEVPDSAGSSGGIRALLAGKAPLARVARALTSEEQKAGLTCVTFAKAPIVFVVHPSVLGIDNITRQDVVGIYSGRITKWETLNAKEGRIYAVTRESGNAGLRVLNAQIPELAGITEHRAKVLYTSPEARDALVGHRNTFGFLTTSAAAGTELRILSVDGVQPSPLNVRSGAYRLVVPLSIVYKDKPTGLARRFIDFLFSKEAQEIISAMGAVPEGRTGR
ncbi:MAG: substrate-binding domain-containing protein [Phycisphaerae bacterium]|nr:substrate-binding domain-containing protein [Phycisphaerae bacterium]